MMTKVGKMPFIECWLMATLVKLIGDCLGARAGGKWGQQVGIVVCLFQNHEKTVIIQNEGYGTYHPQRSTCTYQNNLMKTLKVGVCAKTRFCLACFDPFLYDIFKTSITILP